ncbi:hypothetical protein AB0K89_07965 [Streptomyces cinnamoneus]|uniref:hypothetical protein n=1 Tax=Streptomyces cinnamoneus TaxID=53446 RepID=UPI003430237A
MSALFPRRRNALRAAVASAALASAVLAPAAAFAAEPAPAGPAAPAAPAAPATKATEPATGTKTPAKAEEKKTEAATGTKTDAGTTAGTGKKTEAGTQTGTGKKADAATQAEPAKKDAATQTDPEKCSDKQVYGTWCLVRSTTLPDGTPVNIYSRGPETHRADIMSGGQVVKSVTASGSRDVYFTYNGMGMTLTALRGDLVSGDNGSDSQYLGMENLPQGGVVRVYKVGPHHYQGRILRGGAAGATIDTIEADGKDGYGEYKGQRIRLSAADGSISVQVMGGPDTDAASCTATVEANIGAGTIAVLSNGPKGPQVRYKDGPGNLSGVIMDREHPSDGRTGRIVDPNGAHPQLVTKMQGGGYPSVTSNFPVAPEGCGATGASGAKGSGSTGGGATATNASSQMAQTKAIPQGGVAAGAEGVREGNDTALLAAGGALASVSAAGVAFAVLRRRAVRAGV